MYTVILDEDYKLNVRAVANFLVDVLGITPADARRIVRRCRGFFNHSFSTEQSEKLANYLYEQGINCRIDFIDNIKGILPAPKRVLSMSYNDETVSFLNVTGTPLSEIPWQEVEIISVGFIPGPNFAALKSQQELSYVLPLLNEVSDAELKEELKDKISDWATRKEKAFDTSMERKGFVTKSDLAKLDKEDIKGIIDIISSKITARYRILSETFKYSSVLVEPQGSSLSNFKELIYFLVEKAQFAAFTQVSINFIEKDDYWEALFDDLDEFEQYNNWFAYIYSNTPTDDSTTDENENKNENELK